MAKVVYVHFGASESEFGIDFSTDDGAGGEVRGKAYADADPALKDAVLKAAQAALDALTGTLPADYPPGAITSALMQVRNARQEAEKANALQRDAEEKRRVAEQAIAEAQADHDRQLAEKQAQLAALDEQIKAAEARHAEVQPVT